MIEHRSSWPRGKGWAFGSSEEFLNFSRIDTLIWLSSVLVLGGSSTLNYMLYIRGNKKDFDIWEELGNPGWSFEDVFPYFTKSEDNRDPDIIANGYHGTGGYLTVR